MIDPDRELGARYQSVMTNPDWYQTNIPCQVGCPAHTDVSTYIGLISQARFDEAYLLNREANVVPGVLGRTCARPCEPVCRRNKIDGKPIAICWLKRAAADHREYQHRSERPPITKEKKVAIVGAGSAGLACARDLREMGYPVTIYEDYPTAGGVMVNGIPVWRLPRNVTYEECDEYMADLGVEMRFNTRVGRDIQLTDLLNSYDAVYLAAGCYVPNALTGHDNKLIPGATLKGVEDGIRLLAKTNYGEPAYIGKRVVVYGSGFTGMDCCRTSIRYGADKVYVLYRRSKEEMPADEYEVE
jgi:NADPH-dependent glutamate synthase beta subunit-like oxidoreductase